MAALPAAQDQGKRGAAGRFTGEFKKFLTSSDESASAAGAKERAEDKKGDSRSATSYPFWIPNWYTPSTAKASAASLMGDGLMTDGKILAPAKGAAHAQASEPVLIADGGSAAGVADSRGPVLSGPVSSMPVSGAAVVQLVVPGVVVPGVVASGEMALALVAPGWGSNGAILAAPPSVSSSPAADTSSVNLGVLTGEGATAVDGEAKGLELDREDWEPAEGHEVLAAATPLGQACAAPIEAQPANLRARQATEEQTPQASARTLPGAAVMPDALFAGARMAREAVPEDPVSFVARLTASEGEAAADRSATEPAHSPQLGTQVQAERGHEAGNEAGGQPADHQAPRERARETPPPRGEAAPVTSHEGAPADKAHARWADWRRESGEGRSESSATGVAEVRETNWVTPSVGPSAADVTAGAAPDPAPVSASEVLLPEVPAERLTAPPRELVLTIPSADNDGLMASVHVKDANGAVEIAVRTPDSQLSNSLQEGLPDLVSRLETPGFEASASRGDQGDHQPTDWSGAQERDRPAQEERRGQSRQRQQERRVRWQAALGATAPV